MTSANEAPEAWAVELFCERANLDRAFVMKRDLNNGILIRSAIEAGARLIQQHETRPVDPDLALARQVVETTVHWSPQTDRDIQSGKNDNTPEMRIALAALRAERERNGGGA